MRYTRWSYVMMLASSFLLLVVVGSWHGPAFAAEQTVTVYKSAS